MSSESVLRFVNGNVFTARNETEFVRDFEIAGGRFTRVGDAGGAGRSETIDLGGRTVLPGFIDIHTHPTYVAMIRDAVPCTVPVVNDIPGMIDALRRHPNFGKGPDAWVEGFGYDESKLAERRTPTARDLDRVSTTQPVYVMRSDCHSGICNTRALEIGGITSETPDPAGGHFGRDAAGVPNGILEEHAANDVVLRAKTPPSYEGKVRGIAEIGSHYAERGIVAVTEMMAFTRPYDDLQVYRDGAVRGFGQQAALYFSWAALRDDPISDLTDDQRVGRIRFAGIKLFGDGSISGRTAWVTEPYRGAGSHGYSTLTDDDMRTAHEWARRNRVQIAFHAMGDRAIERAVEFFGDREPWMGSRVPSVRIEHATLLSEPQQQRMRRARMRFGVSMQIIFFFAEHDSYVANLTDGQYRSAYPVRTAYELIPHFGLSSDAPATTWADPDNVFVSIRAAVTRRAYNGAEIVAGQAITVPQAVLLYTARAATVAPFEGSLGQIAPGYEGSFVVLDRDIFSIDPDGIDRVRVEETWIAGERVVRAG
jgi:predicted amidohydrolase YtcJ